VHRVRVGVRIGRLGAGMGHDAGVRRRWRALALSALCLLYLLVSAEMAFLLWLGEGLCDTAEQDCAFTWDAARIVRWAAWGLLGALLAAATVRSWRRLRQQL
jgi:hypothetical protein